MNNEKKCVAVIPVREGSQRIKNKNFKEFADGKNLLELKIEHLQNEKCFDKIYVSSDSMTAKEIALNKGVEFLYRDSEMCSSTVRWSDAIYAVVDSIPQEDAIVAYVHTTSPLHLKYAEPLKAFIQNKDEYDSLVTVTPFQEFIISKKGRPVNYHWGAWHDYSQDLEVLYKVTGALFIAEKQNILKWRYIIGVKPFLYEVGKNTSVDVDTLEDFELAKSLYHNKVLNQH